MNLQKFLNSLSLRQVLIIAGILDALWAAAIATFGANLLHILGVAGGASATSVGIGTVLGWLITFIVALLQGAVFIFVIGFISFVFWSIFSKR
ncbi:MAG: hypothetical protein Q8T09_02960 [Candidatus Melainabacteria bacterium]|nr:hypothetical protein [Candidatus Melainabacteria bacterium]